MISIEWHYNNTDYSVSNSNIYHFTNGVLGRNNIKGIKTW